MTPKVLESTASSLEKEKATKPLYISSYLFRISSESLHIALKSADLRRGSAPEEKCRRMIFYGLEASVLHWQCFRVFLPVRMRPFRHQLGSKMLQTPPGALLFQLLSQAPAWFQMRPGAFQRSFPASVATCQALQIQLLWPPAKRFRHFLWGVRKQR